MKILQPIIDFIKNLDKKQYYRYGILFLSATALILGIMIYVYFSKVNTLRQKIKRINIQRENTRAILEKHERVIQQKIRVDEILEKDKNFKIKQYVPLVIQELNLTQYLSKIGEVTDEDLNNGYIEERLDVYFNNMTMKNIVDLLNALEKNERIYTKELSINKTLKSPVLDVTIVIATLQIKTATS